MHKTCLFLTFTTAGLTHTLKGVSLRPPICQIRPQGSYDSHQFCGMVLTAISRISDSNT